MARVILVVPFQKSLDITRLVKKPVMVVSRSGKVYQSMRWVRPMGDQGNEKKGKEKDAETVRGSKYGYGIHRINVDDLISFKAGDSIIDGTVIDDSHTQGVVVRTKDGRKFNVSWHDITEINTGIPKKEVQHDHLEASPETPNELEDPETFVADDWSKQYDKPEYTADSILKEMEAEYPGVKQEIIKTEQRLKSLEQTISYYRTSGEGAGAVYTQERLKLHDEILQKIFSPEKIANATPDGDLSPVFIMLGGRGGSGKSWFKGKVYDESRAIVLDADEIKGQLGEYEGWNAAQVHEESSDILERALAEARKHGLNVVIDATMKTTKSAIKKVNYFKERGYSVEAHYMYCPRHEAAKRAVKRFMGKSKRYVPVDIVSPTHQTKRPSIKSVNTPTHGVLGIILNMGAVVRFLFLKAANDGFLNY